MKYSSIPSAQTVVYHCKSRGIKDVVISPGSRNAPLTIGFAEDDFFSCYSIVDERCAAFFALGISQQIRRPVILVCTSGSALLNYYPAISEAYYSDIPLVVISADRPQYKIDIGDGQTIRQENVFKNHIGYSANLKLDPEFNLEIGKEKSLSKQEVQDFNDDELNKALLIATSHRTPVHINVPFEEPLYETLKIPTVVPSLDNPNTSEDSSSDDIQKFIEIWNRADKKMILVGTHYPEQIDTQILEKLAKDDAVLVFTETTSNLHHPTFFPSIDSIIAPIEKKEDRDEHFRKLQPSVLLTFGGMIVSKKVKAFLRAYPPEHHWHVDSKKAFNTFFNLSHHFKKDTSLFFKELLKNPSVRQSDYYNYWAGIKDHYVAMRKRYLDEIPFTDMLAFATIMKQIPLGYQLQLANSSTVRYTQLFDVHPSLRVFSNRGTSGIDGSTSTAIGAALYNENPTLLLTGDLSFFYDSNGFWNDYIRPDFRVIVINNGGGGIFRILPGKGATAHFEKYFETVHDLKIERLCAFYDLEYSLADDVVNLNSSLAQFYEPSSRPKLLEIRTPRVKNDEILLNYFDFIS
ncbi:2-succinyl-5-enolpyruvyl-6-hydroxy-3-cyclohexene-1-carboxylic-acid synthase [Muriicola sp. Z0-33]|uniref:2-succinyl-5-enolpyruvyl-6-hydroxy-3- cyclohexene-1-carboxylic-acid synthase n=1 Tax=Muriicola sp. Z0-33 TaxID=2816957 RepID=UPI00223804CB|nr:2-succinyl-5-enolpyruvyl-6-hydroxy-3-cyclohexene-1-carboxylic-acid synthase [Muriicola sp. Z0-33]MCW5516599.1 2-succinyl-5-enolpyruvyl-6-hydroxy-3-cyclohexene-1-carboxylic-acid synthase [Muriicola sp. Z0-33]